jgi:hypothetical protein
MDGCVPDSSKYVPGLNAGDGVLQVGPQHRDAVEFAATSVANDWTRCPCFGGLNVAPLVSPAIGHVVPWIACVGLGAYFAALPRPPPNCPTITIDVGTLFGAVVPFWNIRLLVRLIFRSFPVGMVMTTGDHTPAPAPGFNAAQVAVEPDTLAPQL